MNVKVHSTIALFNKSILNIHCFCLFLLFCFLFLTFLLFVTIIFCCPFNKITNNLLKLSISLCIVHESLVNILQSFFTWPLCNKLLTKPLSFVQFHHNSWQKLLIIFISFINLQKQVLNVQQCLKLNIIDNQSMILIKK